MHITLFLLLFLILHYVSPQTLQDLTEDSVLLYPTSGSIPLDSIRPEHVNIIGVEAIKGEAGDINGDGMNDLVVTTLEYEGVYNFYVIFGKEGGFPEYSRKPKLDEKDGFQIVVKDTANYGIKDAGLIGDVNGDGFADILAVVHGSITNGERKAYLIYGSDKEFPPAVDATDSTIAFFSDRYLDQQGNSKPLLRFGPLGDVNGDGLNDFFIVDSQTMSVIFGNKGFSSDLTSDKRGGIKGFTINNDELSSSSSSTICFGAQVTRAGDFNGDGYADIMMSTKCETSQFSGESKVYIIYGQKTFPDTEAIPLKFLNNPGYPSALIIEPQTNNDFFGSRIASIGDFNRDSLSDVMVSSMFSSNNDVGGTYIFYGQKAFSGTLSQGILETRGDLGVFIPGAGHHIAAIGDLNQDNYNDILLARESFVTVVYGGPSFSKQFSLGSIDGKTGFNITLYSQGLDSKDIKTRIEHIIGLGDIDGKCAPDFAITYGSSKYYIITKDLPKATACIDAQYCLKHEAKKYLDSMLCSSPSSELISSASASETSQLLYYNSTTEGTYNKASQTVIDKGVMSASTAALCGITIGAIVSTILFFIGSRVKTWYKEGIYAQLEEQELDWSSDSRRARIYEIEGVMSEKFKCYQYLLCFFFVFEMLGMATLIAGKEALDFHILSRMLLHGLKAVAYGRAIEGYRRGILEKQKRVVLIMKVLLGIACVFLVLRTKLAYEELKDKWELPETGFRFAMDIMLSAFAHVGIHLIIYLYAKMYLKLMIKREELRGQRRQGGSSPVQLQSREDFENM